jgi:hypothetical protein
MKQSFIISAIQALSRFTDVPIHVGGLEPGFEEPKTYRLRNDMGPFVLLRKFGKNMYSVQNAMTGKQFNINQAWFEFLFEPTTELPLTGNVTEIKKK